ncbi:hypothetical protein B0H11DRAFT_1911862 [Mycena galericulata]|nr:hypothetical protein B0H11DRAFT_1911862 [Mycena galericulata]
MGRDTVVTIVPIWPSATLGSLTTASLHAHSLHSASTVLDQNVMSFTRVRRSAWTIRVIVRVVIHWRVISDSGPVVPRCGGLLAEAVRRQSGLAESGWRQSLEKPKMRSMRAGAKEEAGQEVRKEHSEDFGMKLEEAEEGVGATKLWVKFERLVQQGAGKAAVQQPQLSSGAGHCLQAVAAAYLRYFGAAKVTNDRKGPEDTETKRPSKNLKGHIYMPTHGSGSDWSASTSNECLPTTLGQELSNQERDLNNHWLSEGIPRGGQAQSLNLKTNTNINLNTDQPGEPGGQLKQEQETLRLCADKPTARLKAELEQQK